MTESERRGKSRLELPLDRIDSDTTRLVSNSDLFLSDKHFSDLNGIPIYLLLIFFLQNAFRVWMRWSPFERSQGCRRLFTVSPVKCGRQWMPGSLTLLEVMSFAEGRFSSFLLTSEKGTLRLPWREHTVSREKPAANLSAEQGWYHHETTILATAAPAELAVACSWRGTGASTWRTSSLLWKRGDNTRVGKKNLMM